MNDTASLEGYLAAATDWDRDRADQSRRSARTAWWVAAAGWLCAVVSGAALLALMPLKRVEPYLIRVDRTTGVVDVVPIYAGHATQPQAVTRYFLAHYVTVCRRFNFATAASDYEECGAFQTARENQAWYAAWRRSNPASPLNRYKDGTTVRAHVESISFIPASVGARHVAQIRFFTATRAAGSAIPKIVHYIATVRYAYGAPAADVRRRRWNPLGFKIRYFHADHEVPGEASPPPPAAPAVPGAGANR